MSVEEQATEASEGRTADARALQAEAELARRSRLALLGAEVGAALIQPGTVEEMLGRCTESMVRHLDVAFARVWTLNARDRILELQASSGMYTHRDGPHSRIPLGAFKIGQIAQERQPHLTNHVIGDPRVSDQEWAKREGMVAFAGYPLVVDDRLVGVMAVFARHELTQEVLDALAMISDTVAGGIERKRAEEALMEQTTTLETVNRIGTMLAAELDTEKLVQAVTDAATELTGAQFGAFFYTVMDLQGESLVLYTLSGVPPEAFSQFPMPRNTQIFGPTFRGEDVVRIDNVKDDPRYGRNPPYHGIPEGHPPVASFLSVPVVSPSGTAIGGLFFGHERPGVFTDRAERIVVGLAAQAAVAMDNARLYREAQDAIRMRDEFLMAASHDLRTPLTVVLGQAQSLHRRLSRDLNGGDRILDGLLSIQRRARMMASVIDELMDTTKIGAGGDIVLDLDGIDLAELVRDLVAAHQAANERYTITVHLDSDAVVGQFDRVRLSRVLGNLLNNAIKYSPAGEEIIVYLAMETLDEESYAVITVEDHGMGIPRAELPRIFDRFYRARNALGRTSGTGIGLATSKHIVEKHGGTIAVRSEEGSGSTFTVCLPLHPPPGA